MSRIRLFLLAVILASFLIVSPAFAGGWSVTTLDELPTEVLADEPVTVGFVVRQHGVRLLTGLTPTISARHETLGDTLTVAATEDRPGHYVVELVFPEAGEWTWVVSAFGPEQPLPPLTVLDADSLSGEEADGKGRTSDDQTLAAQGAALFVAKGCVVCHQHDASGVEAWASINVGPDLTRFSAPEEALAAWLANPQAVKQQAKMPNLGLDDEEIAALIAFLNGEAVDSEHSSAPSGRG